MSNFGKIDKSTSVLVVEPDTATSDATVRALEEFNLQVVSVADGNQAIAFVSAKPPQLMILELALPKRGGILVLEYLRLETELVFPIIVLTRYQGKRMRSYAQLLGVTEYLIKPHDFNDVAKRAMKILSGVY